MPFLDDLRLTSYVEDILLSVFWLYVFYFIFCIASYFYVGLRLWGCSYVRGLGIVRGVRWGDHADSLGNDACDRRLNLGLFAMCVSEFLGMDVEFSFVRYRGR